MLGFPLAAPVRPIERVLAIGSHADDIELGCGATILGLTRIYPELDVTWVVLAAPADRASEARSSADAFLAAARSADIRLFEFRDGFLPYVGGDVKEVLEQLKDVQPDVVFTHTRSDLHQDHRLACELTWNTFRDHLILEYEIPKYDGDLGVPNVFVPLTEELVDAKLRIIRESFGSQQGKHWFDDELFRSLMRLRGMEAATQYAEGFTCRKLPLVVE